MPIPCGTRRELDPLKDCAWCKGPLSPVKHELLNVKGVDYRVHGVCKPIAQLWIEERLKRDALFAKAFTEKYGNLFCMACGGNDGDMPCAYPGDGKAGCLRDVRLANEDAGQVAPRWRWKTQDDKDTP